MYHTGQRRYLDAMGIDLWVRRRASPSQDAHSPLSSGEAIEPERMARRSQTLPSQEPAPASSASERRGQVEAAPRVRLACLQVRNLVLIGEIRSPVEMRLARDLVAGSAAVCSGAGWEQPASALHFEWPQTARGDQSPAACKQAFAAFLRGIVDRQAIGFAIVAGRSATALLDRDAEATGVTLWQSVRMDGMIILPVPSVSELQQQPELKRTLWHTVLNSRQQR
jgi:hypothetical protein